jgi:hypothetical protein
MEVMKMSEPCLVKYVRCIGMTEVLRDHVRFIFNRTEGKLEVTILKEYESVRMVSKPFAQIYSIANGQLR